MDVSSIPQDARRRLLLEAKNWGVKPSMLDISRSFLYQMIHGRRKIPDRIVVKLLKILPDDVIARADPDAFSDYIHYDKLELPVEKVIEFITAYAAKHPASATVIYNTVLKELESLGAGKVIRVSKRHLDEWKLYLEGRIREGRMARKTAGDRDRYLKIVLRDLDYTLSAPRIRNYFRREVLVSPDRASHKAKALRLFIKHILQDRDLYNSIPNISPVRKKQKAPDWSEICQVIEATEWPPAKAYLLVLSSTGLRPMTVQNLSLDNIDIEQRLVNVWSDRRTKRDYFGFLTYRTVEYLRFYMEWRKMYLEKQGKKSTKLFPIRRKTLYNEMYETMKQTLGYTFKPRLIRHRVTTHLSRHLSAFEVDALTGHAPKDIVEKYYIQWDNMEDLRSKYDRAMGEIPCL